MTAKDVSSVAGLLMATEAMVAEHPEPDAAPPPALGGRMSGMRF